MNKKKKSTNTSPYPDEVIDRLARAFYPAILACWNSEEGQRSLVGGKAPPSCLRKTVRSLKSPTGAFIAPLRCANASLPHGRRNRLIMQTTKNRKFPPVGNSLLYISLLSVALIASFTSSAILNNLFAICNSRLLPTNQIVNCDGRVRLDGRTLFLLHRGWVYVKPDHRNSL